MKTRPSQNRVTIKKCADREIRKCKSTDGQHPRPRRPTSFARFETISEPRVVKGLFRKQYITSDFYNNQ